MAEGFRAGCPRDQVKNFLRAGVVLQPRQLVASASARLCDESNGPTAIGYGGARGGGKSHWLLAQIREAVSVTVKQRCVTQRHIVRPFIPAPKRLTSEECRCDQE